MKLINMRRELYQRFYTSREWTGHVLSRARRDPREREEIKTFCDLTAHKFDIPNPFDDHLTVQARAVG